MKRLTRAQASAWEENYQGLLRFREENQGRWPSAGDGTTGARLHAWCMRQKMDHAARPRKISKNRIALLDGIGFPWLVRAGATGEAKVEGAIPAKDDPGAYRRQGPVVRSYAETKKPRGTGAFWHNIPRLANERLQRWGQRGEQRKKKSRPRPENTSCRYLILSLGGQAVGPELLPSPSAAWGSNPS